jgi:hypothetical protein
MGSTRHTMNELVAAVGELLCTNQLYGPAVQASRIVTVASGQVQAGGR